MHTVNATPPWIQTGGSAARVSSQSAPPPRPGGEGDGSADLAPPPRVILALVARTQTGRHVEPSPNHELKPEGAGCATSQGVATRGCLKRRGRRQLIRISLAYIYELASNLEPLTNIDKDATYSDAFVAMMSGQTALDGLLNGSIFSLDLRSCRDAGNKLLNELRKANGEMAGDFQRKLAHYAYSLPFMYRAFRTVLTAELGVAPAYFVTRPEAYDTLSLLDDGALLFPRSLQSKVPEAVFDAQQAGKALAFELGTACGFHVFRTTESVLRRYYEKHTGMPTKQTIRNLGVYLNVLKQNNLGDEKVRSALKQMVDLHRNPLIHPEAALTTEDAITIVGIARSAVGMMLADLPDLPTTTTTAER